jgi:Xaa-Pro dipeptidase
MIVGDPSIVRPPQVCVQELKVPNLAQLDFPALRNGRLKRLQDAMRAHGVAIALFYNPANIRYATGTDTMVVWSSSTLERHCLVPAEGEPILFEYRTARHVVERLVKDVRPETSWQMAGPVGAEIARGWGRMIRGIMADLGLAGETLAVDKLDPFGFFALQEAGIRIIDAGPLTVAAREVKTPEEIDLFKINGAIGDVMMADFETAIRPGVREYELMAVLSDTLQRFHGESVFARLVASGTNTNPWMSEAHDKLVQPGDLVGVDTDANGYEGYVIDISRTFLCGDHALPGQKEAYRIAYDCVKGMVELVKPGMTYGEFARLAPELPDAYKPNRYSILAHQAGLEDEGPLLPYLYGDHGVPQEIQDWEIKANTVFCFECFAGKEGAPYGVKLEDQVLVTKDGGVRLSTYPFEAKLL